MYLQNQKTVHIIFLNVKDKNDGHENIFVEGEIGECGGEVCEASRDDV